MNKRNKLKAIALSLGLAAMMMPATMNAQINHGLLQNPYKSQDDHRQGAMGRGSLSIPGNDEEGITNYGIGQDETSPVGSGLVILLGAGLGYVALKKKEDEK